MDGATPSLEKGGSALLRHAAEITQYYQNIHIIYCVIVWISFWMAVNMVVIYI